MISLRQGNRGFRVALLQRLLNKAARRDGAGGKPLREDEVFGPLTHAAVLAFQTRHPPLVADGIAGIHVWPALRLRTEREHAAVRRYGQPTGASCWSAAATMILGNRSVGPGSARLGVGGGLGGSFQDHEAFARSLGWRILDHGPGVLEMVALVRQKPVWISGGGSNWSHAVVLSGVYSDGDPSGDGTLFRVHDPWPIGIGRVYGSFGNPISMYDASGTVRVPASLNYTLVPR